MKMDQQTQNQPDFNFILNQPGPDAPKRPKRSPLVFGFAAVIILAVVGLALMVFFVPAKSVTNVAKTDATKSNSGTTPGAVSEAYIEAVIKKDLDTAYAQLASTVRQQYALSEFKELAPEIYANVSLEKCTIINSGSNSKVIDGKTTQAAYQCPTIKTGNPVIVTFDVIGENGAGAVEAVTIRNKTS